MNPGEAQLRGDLSGDSAGDEPGRGRGECGPPAGRGVRLEDVGVGTREDEAREEHEDPAWLHAAGGRRCSQLPSASEPLVLLAILSSCTPACSHPVSEPLVLA